MKSNMSSHLNRLDDLQRFYAALGRLSTVVDGSRQFSALQVSASWPKRGVYFFFEPGGGSFAHRIRFASGSRWRTCFEDGRVQYAAEQALDTSRSNC